MRPKTIFPLVLCAALVFAAPVVKADTLEPGGSVDLLGGVGLCDTLTTIEPELEEALNAVADCDPLTNALFSNSGIDSIVDTTATAKSSAVLSYLFDVGDDDGVGNTISASLEYGIGWKGLTEAMAGTASVSILIDVVDLTTSKRNKSVGSVVVHEIETTDGSFDDTDSAMDSLALELIRGHQYSVAVELATAATAEATSEEEVTLADYFGEAGVDDGAGIVTLTVSSEFDIAELVEQVMQNTADIAGNADAIAGNADAIDENSAKIAANELAIEANSEAIVENRVEIEANSAAIVANTVAIDVNSEAILANRAAIEANTAAILALGEDLEAVAALLAALRDEFDGHSHTYLTGRGNGHNNTEATTTTPDGDDDDDAVIQPLPSQSQGQGRALGRNQ